MDDWDEIDMIDVLLSIVDDLHIVEVVFHNFIELLLIFSPAQLKYFLFGLLNLQFKDLLIPLVLFLNIRSIGQVLGWEIDIKMGIERWLDKFLDLFHEVLFNVGKSDVIIVFLL